MSPCPTALGGEYARSEEAYSGEKASLDSESEVRRRRSHFQGQRKMASEVSDRNRHELRRGN